MSLEPFRHAHSGDKKHQANNQEQEKEKFRNSRRGRGNPGKPKERSHQCNHQKNNSPTQHNDPPPFSDSPIAAILRACHGGASPREPVVAAVVGRGLCYNFTSSRTSFGPRKMKPV